MAGNGDNVRRFADGNSERWERLTSRRGHCLIERTWKGVQQIAIKPRGFNKKINSSSKTNGIILF